MTDAIHVRGLVKTYPGRPPVEAVRGLDLQVSIGECFGLLGPNGAGKTTTLEILEGLLTPTAGTVRLLGQEWGQDDRALRERIGISLQETRLADKLTVREVVVLFRSLYRQGLDPADAIDRVTLGEKANTAVEKLSGGQRQRLAVACALVGDPELLFLDEPTTGLDPQSRRQLGDVIHAIRTNGRTVVLTTHYMEEAERLCDRVAVVDHGRMIALGTPADLIRQHGGGEHVRVVTTEPPPELSALEGLPGVLTVQRGDNDLSFGVEALHVTLPALLERLQALGQPPTELTTHRPTLEDVFLHLTGRRLRDENTG
jgi:ABC-2 type transport system ATP-binding protein